MKSGSGRDYWKELDDTDYDFLCHILEDEDLIDEYPLYHSYDILVRWLAGEMEERCARFAYEEENDGYN